MLASFVLITALVLAQPEAPAAGDELPAQVKALIRQLDANQQAQREAAEKELVALGPAVLSHLPVVNNRTPAELKNRLSRVRTALMKAAIEASVQPTFVTLSGELPLSEALAAVSKQTGNAFIDYRDRFNQEGANDPKVKLDLKNAPFWSAVDTILDAAQFTLYGFDDEPGALAYTARGDDNTAPRLGRAAYGGLFRIEPTRVETARNFRAGNQTLKVTCEVSWEPRVRPIFLEQPRGELKAINEKEAEIAIDAGDESIETSVEGTNAAVELEFPLQAPDRGVRQIKSLKGKLIATILGRVESFEFVDLEKLKAAEQERGGVTVAVESCRKNGDIYDVEMRVRFDKAANALESHRSWIYNNECYLLDAKGNQIENAGLEATLLDVNEVGLSYKFDLGEEPSLAGCKFIYKTPAAIIKTPVEFELKAIDLP